MCAKFEHVEGTNNDLDTRSDEERETETLPKSPKFFDNEKKDPWESYVPNNINAQRNTETGEFRCKVCNKVVKNEPLLKRHFTQETQMHNINFDGTAKTVEKEEESTEEESESEIISNQNPEIEEIDEILEQKRRESSGNFTSPENIVFDNLNKDIADGATKIAKNIHLQFLYAETKSIFPREWGFEEFVLFHITESLKNWGIHYGVTQDLSSLTEEQLLAVKEAKLAWQEDKGE